MLVIDVEPHVTGDDFFQCERRAKWRTTNQTSLSRELETSTTLATGRTATPRATHETRRHCTTRLCRTGWHSAGSYYTSSAACRFDAARDLALPWQFRHRRRPVREGSDSGNGFRARDRLGRLMPGFHQPCPCKPGRLSLLRISPILHPVPPKTIRSEASRRQRQNRVTAAAMTSRRDRKVGAA